MALVAEPGPALRDTWTGWWPETAELCPGAALLIERRGEDMTKLATGASLAVAGVLVGALAATSAERVAGSINDAVLVGRAESAVKRMFAHPGLIRFESESTRIVELENERIVCGWLNLGPRGQNGTYRHPRRAFSYRATSGDSMAAVLGDYSSSEISQIRDTQSPCGIGGEWIYGHG
jgi:hypothetical protein